MPVIFRALMCLEVPLLIAEELFPVAKHYLPLGGSHLVQMAVLLGAAFTIMELTAAIRELWSKRKKRKRADGRREPVVRQLALPQGSDPDGQTPSRAGLTSVRKL